MTACHRSQCFLLWRAVPLVEHVVTEDIGCGCDQEVQLDVMWNACREMISCNKHEGPLDVSIVLFQ